MGRMLSHQMQEVPRNRSSGAGRWNVPSSINTVLEASTLEVLAEQLRGQCPSNNLSQQGRCRVSDLSNLIPMVTFDHPIIWKRLQPQQLSDC